MEKKVNTGIVVIGRNEGERLLRCLNSVVGLVQRVIYVDSASTDESLAVAKSVGAEVVELDLSTPFTAARARNVGFEKLCRSDPGIIYVQFVDGDCEIVDGWIDSAIAVLESASNTNTAIVCGRLRERHPECSIYNRLCDMEWNISAGETKACGGIFMVRAALFSELHGFNPLLIAGEEPELCLRIRQKGGEIWRSTDEMALHDANICRFSQWWRRNVRGGYAYAEGVLMHGGEAERYCVQESLRIWLWGVGIPLAIVTAALFQAGYLMLLLIYPIQIVRIAMKMGATQRSSWSYAFFMMLGKFPEMQGQLKFLLNKLLKSRTTIIEYK